MFWSRSRQEIWRKGETSGNVQRVVSITADCDAAALVVEVVKSGPACHTGAESCFFNEVYVSPELKQFSWQGLYQLIKGRKDSPKEGSYTTYLFEKLSLIHISASRSAVMDTTRCTLPLVSPLRQIS